MSGSIKFNKNYHKLEKWMSSAILTSRWEKIQLCNLSLSNLTLENLEAFKRYRNAYKRVISAAKKNIF
jgi:hypothetical protein